MQGNSSHYYYNTLLQNVTIYREVNISESRSIFRFIDSVILGV